MSRARTLANGVTTFAPLASPDFTGTVDLTGTTVNLDDDEISGDKIAGGTIGSEGVTTSFRGVFTDAAAVGMVLNMAVLSDNTRTPVSVSNLTDIEFYDIGDYNKLYSGTNLIIQVVIQAAKSDDANFGNVGIKYGSSATYWGGAFNFGSANATQFMVVGYWAGHTTTGAQAISLRMGSNSSTNTRPCYIVNPNSTDDGRLFTDTNQPKSVASIYEVGGS